MKKLSLGIMACSISFLTCCKQDSTEDSADMQGKEQWAELVETKTIFVKPEGWEDSYWESVNKKVELNKLFNTVVDAVLSGKVKAYDIFTDSLLTVERVKEMVILPTEASNDSKVNAEDISLIRMREKWVFDKERFHLEKQVSRLDLIYKYLDEAGEYIGDKALFYVNLN